MTTQRQTAQPTQAQPASAGGILQRACACGNHSGAGGECEECKKKRSATLQRAAVSTPPVSAVPPIVHDVLRSSGRPLDPATRAFMEPRFGHDFSGVRVHADTAGAESARAVRARAYAVGSDIVFGADQYAPNTPIGRHLLAHELAHVVQQCRFAAAASDVTVAGDAGEAEAEAAAQAVSSGGTVPRIQPLLRPGLARVPQSQTLPQADGSEIVVNRVITPGRCAQRPQTRTATTSDITRSQAFLELDACRGQVGGGVRGEINYGDALNDAASAVATLLSSLATGSQPQAALRTFENSLSRVTPNAQVRLNLRAPGFRVELGGTGEASAGGGATGEGRARTEFDIGPVTIGAEGSIRGGTQEPTSGQVLITVSPRQRRSDDNCFPCSCSAPRIEFQCVRRPPPTRPEPPPRREPVIVPLFFEYQDIIPRRGWEQRYQDMLAMAIARIREGYTIARIEGNASPEGPLGQRRGSRFQGNVRLAERRAQQAQADLQARLHRELGSLMAMRGGEHLRAALAMSYQVEGRAELFGSTPAGEVANRDLPRHLRQVLQAPQPGQADPLAEAHVTGAGLPPEVQAEVETQIDEFRTRQRGSQRLTEAQQLEAIYQPLRRSLIFLNPPPPPPPQLRLSQQNIEAVIGAPISCTDAHRNLFRNVPLPASGLFEGECREPGERTRSPSDQ